MGCVASSTLHDGPPGKLPKTYTKPRWKSDVPLTAEGLQKMREDFWDTQPHYGGDRVVWDTLRAACEMDLSSARLILETAAITVASPDMTMFYDERGAKYELPKYIISAPANLAIAA